MKSAREWFESGKKHILQYEIDDGITDLNHSIALDDTNAQAYRIRGKAYCLRADKMLNLLDIERGMDDLNHSIQLDPYCTLTYIHRSILHRANARFSEALEDINQAIALKPNSAYAYRIKAVVLESMRDYDQAVVVINQALALKSESIKLYYLRASFNLNLFDFDKAYDDIQRMREINATHEKTHLILNHYYQIMSLSLGNTDEIIQCLTEAICNTTDTNERYHLHLSRGTLYHNQAQLEDALADYSQVIDLRPTGSAYLNRAGIHFAKNEFDNALCDLEKAITLENTPDSRLLHFSSLMLRAEIHDIQNNIYQAACDYAKVRFFFEVSQIDESDRGYDTEKYDPLINLINELTRLKNHYSPNKVLRYNKIVDEINLTLKKLGSNETPLNRLQSPQPLVSLVGFLVTKNRNRYHDTESCLVTDLIEKLDNHAFLIPEDDQDKTHHAMKL